MVRAPKCADAIVLKRLVRVEVIDEDCGALLVDNQFVVFVAEGQELVIARHYAEQIFPFVHCFIEFTKLTVAQVLITK